MTYTQADFCRDVLAAVPEAEPRVRGYLDGGDPEGRVHAVTWGLAEFVQASVGRADRADAIRRALAVAAAGATRPDADPEIPTAVHVTFLLEKDIQPLKDAGLWRDVPERIRRYLRDDWA